MAKFKTSVCRKFENSQEEIEETSTSVEDTVFYNHSKYIQRIFEDTDSDISDEEEY